MSGWQTKFSVSPVPGLWSLVLRPFGPDLGPDLHLTWDLDLDLSLTILYEAQQNYQDRSKKIALFNERKRGLKEGHTEYMKILFKNTCIT